MLRLLTLLFTALLVGLPLTTSAASAAPAPSAVHASQSDDPADDDATADDSDSSGDDANADDSSDDSVDLSAYCSLLGDDSGSDDSADDSADDGTITIDLGVLDTLGPDAQDDPESADDSADDSSATDEDCAGAEDSADSTPSSGTRTASVSDMLKTGAVSTGTVTMSGPGTITQELWLPAVAPAKHGLRAVGSSKTSAKARKVKTKAKARKAAGRTLGGRMTRTVTRAGVVNLKITLNAAARKLLRNSKKDVRITVKTTTRVKGGKAQIKNGTLVARRKAAK